MSKIGLSVVAGLALSVGLSGVSLGASQMSEAEYRAALEACKSEATAKLKDECVSNARNRYERGKGAEKKAGGMADEAEKAGKAKAMGKSDAGMKGAKEKGAEMMKSKGKAKTN